MHLRDINVMPIKTIQQYNQDSSVQFPFKSTSQILLKDNKLKLAAENKHAASCGLICTSIKN